MSVPSPRLVDQAPLRDPPYVGGEDFSIGRKGLQRYWVEDLPCRVRYGQYGDRTKTPSGVTADSTVHASKPYSMVVIRCLPSLKIPVLNAVERILSLILACLHANRGFVSGFCKL